jgi:hypothetical protein
MRNKIIFLFLLSLFVTGTVFSFDNLKVHLALTAAAADLYNTGDGGKLTSQQIDWLVEGSQAEDTDPRYLHHYYNPSTGKGLDSDDTVFGVTTHFTGIAAKDWAKNQAASLVSLTGDYSVGAILDNYRQENYRRAYQGVGHIMHLVQDMAVPAHTRNDSHAMGDPFESWAQDPVNPIPEEAVQQEFSNLDTAFDGLANYSHENFLSLDTVKIDNVNDFKIVKDIDGSSEKEYLVRNYKGVEYKYALIDQSGLFPIYILDNSKVHLDYWNMLSPKAVGYSAGVINYFIKQFKQIDEENKQSDLSLLQKTNNLLAALWGETRYSTGDTLLAESVAWQEKGGVGYAMSKLPNRLSLALLNEVTGGGLDKGKTLAVEAANKAGDFVADVVGQSLDAANRAAVLGEKAAAEISKPLTKLKPVIKITNPLTKNSGTGKSPSLPLLPPSPPSGINPIPGGEKGSKGEKAPIPNLGFMMLAGPPLALAAEEIVIPEDTVAPVINIISGVFIFSNSSTSEFILQSNESPVDYYCNVDDGGWQDCSATTTIEYLSEGPHVLAVKAVDAAGNTSVVASTTWLVDLTAPTVNFVPLDAEYASSSIPVYWMGEDAVASSTEVSGMATFDLEYRINAEDWQAWFSGILATSSVFDKTATSGDELYFRLRARDRAGNVSAWQEVQTKIADAEPDKVVISEIYGGGGNSGATYKNDFIELYNPTGHDIPLDGWSVQYASASGAFGFNITALSGVILSKSHYLIQEKTGAGGTQDLPAPEAAGNINLAATAGKVALVKDNQAIINRSAMSVIDFVGYGTASEFEGAGSAIAPSNKASIGRDANHTDSDSNDTDFIVLDPPQPENASGAMPLVPPVCRTIPIDAEYNIMIDTLTAGHNPYCVPSGDPIQIPAGQIVNIEPGTIIKFEADAYMNIYGELNAIGTTDKKIIFTSIYDNRMTPGQIVPTFTDYWLGMYVAPGGRLDLDYAQVHDVGRAGWLVSAKPKKTRSNVRLAIVMIPTYPAIAVRDGVVVINHSEISHNSLGFQAYGASTVEISNSSLINNTEGGLFNNGSNYISAINNWWGDASGPYDYINNAAGLGQQIGGKINYSPWLLSAPN